MHRYRTEGSAGLTDQQSSEKRSPRRLTERAEAEILAARASTRYGPDRLGRTLQFALETTGTLSVTESALSNLNVTST